MRLQHLALLASVAAGVVACGGDTGGTTTVQPPLAYVRYVHAMPDTGIVDVRVVDKVENLNMFQLGYGTVTPYNGVQAGSRHFKVFVATTDPQPDPAVVSQVIKDTVITLQANTYYTFLHTGYARTGQTPSQHIVVIQDAAPTPAASQYMMRAVVVGPGQAAGYDVFKYANTTTTPDATGLAYSNLTYNTTLNGGYTPFATGAAGLQITATGSFTPVIGSATVPAGSAASGATSAAPGSTIAGTVLTAFIFPPGVAGSPAASTRAAITYGIDRRP